MGLLTRTMVLACVLAFLAGCSGGTPAPKPDGNIKPGEMPKKDDAMKTPPMPKPPP